jgi:site-specific DNA-methyltransferase (adenine-specific)
MGKKPSSQPGHNGRNGKQPDKKRGFTSPRPKEDRRAAVDPWKLRQLLPPLSPAEYQDLKESIRRDGVLVPSIVDAEGNIVDGDHRERACKELGIFCPREVREFGSEAEKVELALRLNVNRRHLSRAQRRELIAACLKANPRINDRHVADIVKVSKNTVAAERRRLERTGQVDHLEHRLGRDGKLRPAKHRRIIANTLKEAKTAMEAIKNLPQSCEGKILDAASAARRAKKNFTRQKWAGEIIESTPEDEIRLFHCQFQELEQRAPIDPESVRAVITDPPYGDDFFPQIAELAEFASRVLVEGGLFVMMMGKLRLSDVMEAIGKHLQYGWVVASAWEGAGNIVWPRNVISRWKPVLVYSKGNWPEIGRWSDVTRAQQEKEFHDWQQPIEEFELLVRYFSHTGDLIVDPCGGSFTTALACKRWGRRFIGCDVDRECILKGQARLKKVEAALVLPDGADGKECDEHAADDIEHAKCPFCGRRFPVHGT